MASDLDWRDEQRELAGILGRHLRSHAEGEALVTAKDTRQLTLFVSPV